MATLEAIESKCLTMLDIGGISEDDARWLGYILDDCRRAKEFTKYAEDNFDRSEGGISDFIRGFHEHYDIAKAKERRADRIAQVVEEGPTGDTQ